MGWFKKVPTQQEDVRGRAKPCRRRPLCRVFLRVLGWAVRLAIVAAYVVGVALMYQRWRRVMRWHTVSPDGRHHNVAWNLAGMFMIATVPISMHQIWQHLTHFVEPRQQSQIVRIIMTVPVYSFAAYASLRWYEYAMQINLCREIYEAYVIYCFLQYLIHYLDEKRDLSELLALRPATHGGHTFPFCCLPTWSMGAEFLDRVRTGVVQFVMMRVGTTVAALVMDHHGVYQEGAWDPRYGFVWCFVFNAISQAFALYTLIKFYHATHKDLEAIRPFGKFICIKAVIFLSWWQAIAVSTLVHQKELHKTTPFEANEVAKAIQDILICMEMFLASIAYSYVFPLSEMVSSEHLALLDGDKEPAPELSAPQFVERRSVAYALWASSIPLELQDDFYRHMGFVCNRLARCCGGALHPVVSRLVLCCRVFPSVESPD